MFLLGTTVCLTFAFTFIFLFCLFQTIAGIFEKFKEKKQNVVTSLREAADAVYLSVRNIGSRAFSSPANHGIVM